MNGITAAEMPTMFPNAEKRCSILSSYFIQCRCRIANATYSSVKSFLATGHGCLATLPGLHRLSLQIKVHCLITHQFQVIYSQTHPSLSNELHYQSHCRGVGEDDENENTKITVPF